MADTNLNSNTDLTPEEKADLAESRPDILRLLESGNPLSEIAGRGMLTNWRAARSIGEEATEQAALVRAEVAAQTSAQGPEQGSLSAWCGYPTDLTRCSPFFPMNSNALGQREFLREFVITSANWGEIKYTGPKLSTYEEDALMALLVVIDRVSKNRVTVDEEGKKTYTYRGPALPLLKLLGHKTPGKDRYKNLISGLELLMSAVVKLSVSSGKTKTGKKRAPRYIHLSNMLSCVVWDDEKKELSATVNPFFYETYYAGSVTYIDVMKRIALKGSIAKALYRFVQSHRESIVFKGHFLTLADALNMDRDQPAYKTRQLIKTAITELIRQGILTKKSRFVEQDLVTLERSDGSFPQGKKAIKKE